jgi:hypothetical protein
MTKFEELQQDLEQTLAKLKAATEPERRRFYLREMSRLLAEGDRILKNAEERPRPVIFRKPERWRG